MKSEYTLEGHGARAEEAGKDLEKEESQLCKKLKIESINVLSKTVYSARYVGRESEELSCSEFEVQSGKGWDSLEQEAIKHANGGGLESYDATFSVSRTYNLTPEQIDKAVNKKKTSPSAGGLEDGMESHGFPMVIRP